MSESLKSSLVIIAGVVFAAAVAAQGPPPPPPPPPPMPPGTVGTSGTLEIGTGLILGRVIEAGTNKPIPEAMVTLTGAALGSASQRFSNGSSGGPRLVQASGDGRFLFRDLPFGDYQVTAYAQGFSSGGYMQAKPVQVRRSLDPPRPVEVGLNEKRGDVTIALWRHGSISGVVMDEAGEPVVDVNVTVLTRTLVAGAPVMQTAVTAVTDDRGMYWAEVVPGDYVVGVLTASVALPAALIDEWQAARNEGRDAAAQMQGRITATGIQTLSSTGVRVGEAIVQPGRSGWVSPPLANAKGQVAAYPTTFHPAASSPVTATVISVRSGEDKTGINLQLVARMLPHVAGRVVGPNGPVPGAGIRLITADSATQRSSTPPPIDDLLTVSGPDGRFVFPAVPPGQYWIRALQSPRETDAVRYGPGPNGGFTFQPSYDQTPTYWLVQSLAVGDSGIDDLLLTAKRGGRFTGRVVFEGSPTPATVEDLRFITVFPRSVPGTSAALALVNGAGRPNPTGDFSTPEFVPGPYLLEPANLPRGWIVKSVMVNGMDAADVPVDLPEGGLSNIVITLTDKLTRVVGFVKSQGGQAPVGATVGIFPVERTMWRRVGLSSRRTQTTVPRRDGFYVVGGSLPAGDYYVVATEGEIPDWSDPATLTSLIPSATRISVGLGEIRQQNLTSIVRK